jgi:putative peptidoglycan lipid II flippase
MAMATSIAGWVNVALMIMMLVRRHWLIPSGRLKAEVGKILLACVAMAAVLIHLHPLLAPYAQGELMRFLMLFALVASGSAVYFTAAYLLDILRLRGAVNRWMTGKKP